MCADAAWIHENWCLYANTVFRAQSSATLTRAQSSPDLLGPGQIANLCASLEVSNGPVYGYLIEEESLYEVFKISRHNVEATRSATLDQILQGGVSQRLTRSQRYNISLILASTFLQLSDSPWLPVLPKRSDIIFFSSNNNGVALFRLDQPHISRTFKPSNAQNAVHAPHVPDEMLSFNKALDHLGIMLLELCFGQLMEDQRCRKDLPTGANDLEKAIFDIAAAREWMRQVIEEAGGDYAEAVSWCLGGNRTAPSDRWRQIMLLKVIQPLHRCCEHFSKGGMSID